LSITGERVFRGDAPRQQYYRIENSYGRFERHFDLPRTVDASRVEAKYYDGVLTLTLPKASAAKPKKIPIIIDE
jgi:HSP20 family protein